VFKKTEETEWTRFSKALSSRERDEQEATAEVEVVAAPPTPAPTAPTRTEPVPAPPMRQPTSDVNVSARPMSRPSAPSEQDEDVESTIGEHTTIDGTFRSENSIRVRGTVQGEIESTRSVLIETQANVTAKVTGASVMIAGQVNGQIFCTGRVEIKPSGRVTGEINAGTLIMQEGAYFEGHLKMSGGGVAQATTEAEAIAAAR
jgi:cytoskeletal protein CcmA (bactofilin family)